MRTSWILLLAMSALILSSCGSLPTSQQSENPIPIEPLSPYEGDATDMVSTPIDPGLQSLIETAKEDLAKRIPTQLSQIDLIKAQSVVWPDASLGCPQPGMKYKQVPEDGALIVLQVEGIIYRYHSGDSRELFLCETVYKDPNSPPKIDIFNLTPFKPGSDSSTPDNSIPPGEDQ